MKWLSQISFFVVKKLFQPRFFYLLNYLYGFFALLLHTSVYAIANCPNALPTQDPNFCHSFEISAHCYCLEANLPQSVCKDLDALYKLMMMRYFSLANACKHQNNVPVQVCIDDWNCYRHGGKDSNGKLCSATGKSCRVKIVD